MIYGVLYASTSDSRWHESSHGTAFKTDWLNDALYEIASFMVMRESSVWRWSHTRHHSDTIIVWRDPEIAVPRPRDILGLILGFFSLKVIPKYFQNSFRHALGRLTAEEKTFIPESEYGKVFLRARICLLIYAGVFGLAIWQQSILPLMFIGLPTIYGSWLMPVYGHTQHAGLAENVLDHRLNCRTVKMNLVNRYLYWNMNFHVEHHMFPLVPYHILLYIGCFGLSVGPVTWVILSEIFPTAVRGRALGLATFFLWTADYAVTQTFPMMDAKNSWFVAHFNHAFPFYAYAAFCAVLLLAVWRLVPETKGRSLEEIERNWAGK